MIYLPNHLVREILIRLPIKSLLRSRRVCHAWRILIQHLSFSDLHQNPYNTLISFLAHRKSLCLLYLDPAIHDYDTYELKEQVATSGISTCNGLLCYISRYYTLHVINPITKQYLSLPKPPLQLDDRLLNFSYGIGFHAATNEYKVVFITQREGTAPFEVEIWTLGCSTSWRYLGKIPYFIYEGAGFFVQGALHWWMRMSDHQTGIVSMNMGSEEFCAIESSFSSSDIKSTCRMMELNGHLAVVDQRRGAKNYSCWVLKDYPRKDEGTTRVSWIKELSFEWDDPFALLHRRPFCVQKNGEILVLDGKKRELLSYNIEKRSFMLIKSLPLRVPLSSAYHLVNYVPSLAGWKQEP